MQTPHHHIKRCTHRHMKPKTMQYTCLVHLLRNWRRLPLQPHFQTTMLIVLKRFLILWANIVCNSRLLVTNSVSSLWNITLINTNELFTFIISWRWMKNMLLLAFWAAIAPLNMAMLVGLLVIWSIRNLVSSK